MNRLEEIRKIVDSILMEQPDLEERRCGFVHLYGVSCNCSLLALKRGMNAELCAIAGMLHDISSYKTGYSADHSKLSSVEARKILNESNYFEGDEIDIICSSISNHSNKHNVDGVYDEILKDADVLQHYLYNTNFQIIEHEKNRLNNLFKELGINL
ncbi:HD domain-containing protein [Alkaliphilus sp. MSJ-5]|uniref:HD domain-containing protein n=1 Tax=Alkaliphilus flagellatus TaxID=2841507 RepID=A0ABS6G6A5_9FIRM|nr:HD domain-containing protein [Alkaliphilus flagellatus]MBU5676921.1 HD domain-containing protein [Alkaliphilus flagellatus]